MAPRAEAIEINQRWSTNWDNQEGITKNWGLGKRWIRDHAEEGCLFEKVWPGDVVTPQQCDRSVNSRTPVMIEHVRKGAWAMPISFDGETDAQARMGERYEIAFFKLQTQEVRYRIEDTWTYDKPISEMFKEDIGQAYIEAKDRVFIINNEVACWFGFQQLYSGIKLNNTTLNNNTAAEVSVYKSTGAKLATNAVGTPVDTYNLQELRKEDITIILRSFNSVAGEQLQAKSMAITEYDYLGITDWDISQVGDAAVASSVRSVAGINALKGVTIHRTIKHRWLRPGNIYAWADLSEEVGSHYRIGSVETYQEKRGTEVTMFSWGFEGFGYANMAGTRKLELFSASDNPQTVGVTEDAGTGVYVLARVRPLGETHTIENAQVDLQGWYPQMTQF